MENKIRDEIENEVEESENEVEESENEGEMKSLASLGFPNYLGCKSGKIYNVTTGHDLRGNWKNGFLTVNLFDEKGNRRQKRVHLIIGTLFLKKSDKPFITHVDRNRENNAVINLKWATLPEIKEPNNKRPKGRTVFQYNLDGSIFQKWDSLKQASEHCGIALSSLSKALKYATEDFKEYRGFLWKKYGEDLPGEIWNIVPYDELEPLFASNYGRVKTEKKILEGCCGESEYHYVYVFHKNLQKYKNKPAHRLVLAAFKGRNEDLCVNHIDLCRSNNKIENLEYTTIAENNAHSIEFGGRDFTLEPHRLFSREVNRIDDEGNITTFKSACEASRQTGITHGKITWACKSENHRSEGYTWEYSENQTDLKF